MVDIKEQWNAFDTKDLTMEKTKDLLRLCGFAPQEKEIHIPRCFEEFEELSKTIPPPMPREKMAEIIKILNCGTHITKKDLQSYFKMGDKFDDKEMEEFLKLCKFDKNDEITVEELAEVVYDP